MKPRRLESETIVSSSATAGATSLGSVVWVSVTGGSRWGDRPWQGRSQGRCRVIRCPAMLAGADFRVLTSSLPGVNSVDRPISVVRPNEWKDEEVDSGVR